MRVRGRLAAAGMVLALSIGLTGALGSISFANDGGGGGNGVDVGTGSQNIGVGGNGGPGGDGAGASGGGGAPAGDGADVNAPQVKGKAVRHIRNLRVLSQDLSVVQQTGKLRVQLRAIHPATVDLAIFARVRGVNKEIAGGLFDFEVAGVHRVGLRLTPAGWRLLRRSDHVSLKAVAKAFHGNEGVQQLRRISSLV
jgi:hypothetical protein